MSQRFDLAFEALTQDSVPQYRMRYVLGKLTQFVNEEAYRDETSRDLSTFVSPNDHVEHILPQTPTPQVLSAFDQPERIDEYIPMLGNLCLIEDVINCAVGNQTFAEKREAYGSSTLLLTKAVAHKVHVGVDTRIDQAVAGLGTWDEWTSRSILERQLMLGRLARKVWDMPETQEPT